MKDLLVLWNYLCLNTKPKKSDCIIGLGSILTLVPKKCAELYKENLGDYIIFSGNCGKGTEGVITKTEAERFRDVAIEENVSKDKILLEPEATTTYENYKYIKKLLTDNNLMPNSFLVVGKPYQERRALAIAEVEFPNKEITVASYNMTLDDYLEYVKSDKLMNVEDVVNEMIGEISLIKIAPLYGLQSKQEIPDEVMESWRNLIDLGYNKYAYSNETVRGFKDKMIEKRINLKNRGEIINFSIFLPNYYHLNNLY